MRRNVQITSLFSIALAGCGAPLETGTYKPALATIKGMITQPPDVTLPNAPIRVALLWSGPHPFGQIDLGNSIAQEVGVQSQFPVQFNLDLTDPPPPAVIKKATDYYDSYEITTFGIDPNMQWAEASAIVYADNNKNGKFDIVADSSQTSPDTVLSYAVGLQIFYLVAGTPAPPEYNLGVLPTTTGLSLLQDPPVVDPQPGDCGYFDSEGHEQVECGVQNAPGTSAQILPSTATITFTLSSDPSLEKFACATYWGPDENSDWANEPISDLCVAANYTPSCTNCIGPNCPGPLDLPPAGVSVTCSADKTEYAWKTCSDDASLCGTTFCHFGHGERDPSQPVPANWPCN